MREGTESEAKFIAVGPSVFPAMARLKRLGPFRLAGRSRQRQKNIYLDTPDLRLKRSKAALKLRVVGRRAELIFKRETGYRRGVSRRWEVSAPVRAAGVRGLDAGRPLVRPLALARRIAGRHPLDEVLTLRTVRRRLLFESGNERLELDLDRVSVSGAGRGVRLHREAELENLSGSEKNFMAALADLRRRFRGKIRPSKVSKYEIGLALLKEPVGRSVRP